MWAVGTLDIMWGEVGGGGYTCYHVGVGVGGGGYTCINITEHASSRQYIAHDYLFPAPRIETPEPLRK